MQKEILKQLVEQSKTLCEMTINSINEENKQFRLNEKTASVGFIYRHIGECTNVVNQFFGYPTEIHATTVGQSDQGLEYDLLISQKLFQDGYATLEKIVDDTSEQQWLEEIDTPWFGRLSRIKILTINLGHNAHHCGQMASAIAKGHKF